MNSYKCLKKQIYSDGEYSIVPIRFEDRYEIMKWRNEQIYHLRQSQPLTKESQDNYFKTVVANLFDDYKPDQILFSYLENEKCIGYGGLVHIDWLNNNAEISFVMATEFELLNFKKMWSAFLKLIKIVAFKDLNLHKIFTYAFDLRPKLFEVLLENGFLQDARLKDHLYFDGIYKDIVIHYFINPISNISHKKANLNDAKLLFDWANDLEVRENSFDSREIVWENHVAWLESKIRSSNSIIYIFYSNSIPIGQVRLDKRDAGIWYIDYSVDRNFRNLGIGKLMISYVIELNPDFHYRAQIKSINNASVSVFRNLHFNLVTLSGNNKDTIEYEFKK